MNNGKTIVMKIIMFLAGPTTAHLETSVFANDFKFR